MPAPIFDEPVVASSRTPVDWRQVRDLVGLMLVVVGVIGLVVTAWIWHPLAGLAATFGACVGLGFALGYDW